MWFIALLALAAGAANPFQSATNAELNKHLQQPLWAGVLVYATGLGGLMLLQAFVRQPLPGAAARSVPWWAWMGGLISLGSTMTGILLTQKLGSGLFTGLSLTAAIVSSVLLDQFGALGLQKHAASPARLVGCALMIAGVWLVARF